MIAYIVVGEVLGKVRWSAETAQTAVFLAVLVLFGVCPAWVVVVVVLALVCLQLAQCWAVVQLQACWSKPGSGDTTVNLQAGCLGEARHLTL